MTSMKQSQFEQLRDALTSADVSAMSADYGELDEDFGKFWRRQIFPRFGFFGDINHAQFNASEAMEKLSAYTVLQLLSLKRNTHYATSSRPRKKQLEGK